METFGRKYLLRPENSGLIEFEEVIQTKFRGPPQLKSSKAQIQTKFNKIPAIRFEDQKLTSCSRLLIFQLLFMRMNLKQRLGYLYHIVFVKNILGQLFRSFKASVAALSD